MKSLIVIPAKAEIQSFQQILDSGFRRSDGTESIRITNMFRSLELGICDLFVIWCL